MGARVNNTGQKLLFVFYLALAACAPQDATSPREDVRIGSKKFTESVILAEMAAQLAASNGAHVVHRQELGGTRLLWDALLAGEIDAYPEYTATLTGEILADEDVGDERSLARSLANRGVQASRPLGFSNAYGLAMTARRAAEAGIAKISDLAGRPSLRFGFSDEFLNRTDGWPALRAAYRLSAAEVRGIDHDIAYKGLVAGAIDVMDVYATDPEIFHYRLRLLDDDFRVFPDNEAVFLIRSDLNRRAPKAVSAMLRLEGRIDRGAMMALNRAVKIDRRSEAETAAEFLALNFGLAETPGSEGLWRRLLRRTGEHLELTISSLCAAIVVALPLGVVAAKYPLLGRAILAGASVVQTIPALALLVFMLPLLGIGPAPAIAALFLYSLLPIIRNTQAGLLAVSPSLRVSAIALGLTPVRRLMLIELPMASPAILAGVKTASVINVGTATLGALIGAGGYGQPIFTGLRLDNYNLILEGAAPAALLALLVQGLFEYAERHLVPRGLRLEPMSLR